MDWSELHDVYLCREILTVGLMKTKKKTTQRAQLWEQIAKNSCAYDQPKFFVTKRAVRDRYAIISSKYRRKINAEEKASGISPENVSELDSLLEDIIERECMTEEEVNENKRKVDEDKLKAIEVRQLAMEKLSGTKKRKDLTENDKQTAKKSRRSGSETVEFLRNQCTQELKLKELEFESRKQEQEAKSVRSENALKRHESLMEMMAQQQQVQQQQTANFQAMMVQQNQALMSLMAQIIKK